MAEDLDRNPAFAWLDHVQPTGLVLAKPVLRRFQITPEPQTAVDSAAVERHLNADLDQPALKDAWAFVQEVLGWQSAFVHGTLGGPALPEDQLTLHLPEHQTTLRPDWAIWDEEAKHWSLLITLVAAGVEPDKRNAGEGWEATPHQRFERLLREKDVFRGLMITDKELRLIHAPRGETSGWISFPLRSLKEVAGRMMLGGLKLILGRQSLLQGPLAQRLPALMKASRDEQAEVSTKLAGQVLGALHELLRGLDAADRDRVRRLAAEQPARLYEGLLTVLMRLVFVLYAEDRGLLPSRTDGRAQHIYETSYSVRGLFSDLLRDVANNPDTMEDRRGGWGRMLALFRLIHRGHRSGFVQARGGKLFDPDAFPFLEGRDAAADAPTVTQLSDGTLLRILDGLMTIKGDGGVRERLSYRTLDVEQIGSVYETVMGFTVTLAKAETLAIKAGKNNKTPVFVDLAQLLAVKGKDRVKHVKEETGRALNDTQKKPVEAAQTIADLAAAFDNMVDERGSPRKRIAPAGTPVLQPTGERRRTGSHYTPRSLTEPIVKHALEPAFARLGPDARPEDVLALKVCDPAMGSGAFLVEACRALAARVVKAWERWPETRPVIPPDEDEDLHARRLVAQRCLYGVDRNPLATDLAKLSLWLATLARDHEFSFLDHALKSGDSLVGLNDSQIAAMNWDLSKPGLPLFRQFVADRVKEVTAARTEIQTAADDTSRAILEGKHRLIEQRIEPVRILGDAALSAFFAEDKPKVREKRRATIESWVSGIGSAKWDDLKAAGAALREGEHPVAPFHWNVEFPEVFARENPGFDAIVGNPPFAGKNTIIAGNRKNYLPWMQVLHTGAHGNADLVAHFFRRAFGLLRQGGVFGLIATNTIGQGDTRASGLTTIIGEGGTIIRAKRRLKWPGEAAVVVSVVHIVKGAAVSPVLDERSVRRISAYLVEGDLDTSPVALAANSGQAFTGSYILGMGFTFDDTAAAKGVSASIAEMGHITASNPKNAERIFPYIAGEEINTDPQQSYRRFVIDFSSESELEARNGWPDLMAILERYVKNEREKKTDKQARELWWQFLRPRWELRAAIREKTHVLTMSRVSSHLAVCRLATGPVFSIECNVLVFDNFSPFAALQCRAHELWARFFSSTLEDRLRYTPSDCFRTFPFPADIESDPNLEAAGEAYHGFRAQLMITRNEGLTKTYNRFHDRAETKPDITELRRLHADMDAAVLRAYGWDDLADEADPVFNEQEGDDGKKIKTRFDWPADFKDEVLARLLALNATRAAQERAAGLVAADEGEDEGDAA